MLPHFGFENERGSINSGKLQFKHALLAVLMWKEIDVQTETFRWWLKSIEATQLHLHPVWDKMETLKFLQGSGIKTEASLH